MDGGSPPALVMVRAPVFLYFCGTGKLGTLELRINVVCSVTYLTLASTAPSSNSRNRPALSSSQGSLFTLTVG